MPALTRALKLQEKAGKVGFDWNDARAVLAKLREEMDEIEVEIDARDARESRGRGRRSPVRRRQSRAPSQRRSRSRAARRQRQIRASFRLYRNAPRSRRARAGAREPRGNGGAVERGQTARTRRAMTTAFVALIAGDPFLAGGAEFGRLGAARSEPVAARRIRRRRRRNHPSPAPRRRALEADQRVVRFAARRDLDDAQLAHRDAARRADRRAAGLRGARHRDAATPSRHWSTSAATKSAAMARRRNSARK